jgi:DNA (cytosine-5)-methyltransferase 1
MIDRSGFMEVADVCSGLGNFSFGLECTGFFRTTSFCEVNPHCREWLDQQWPGIPIHSDLRTLHGEQLGSIDVLVGGIPCQPASLAGKRAGSADERWLWPDFLRLAAEASPRWIVAENPVGIVTVKPHGLEWIHKSLEQTGYEVLPIIVGADDCGAPHQRARTWIIAKLADSDSGGFERIARSELFNAERTTFGNNLNGRDNTALMGDTPSPGQSHVQRSSQDAEQRGRRSSLGAGLPGRWPARRGEPQHDWEPARVFEIAAPPIGLVGGLPDGAAARLGLRLNRSLLKALGNGITPQIPYEIGLAIAACEGMR